MMLSAVVLAGLALANLFPGQVDYCWLTPGPNPTNPSNGNDDDYDDQETTGKPTAEGPTTATSISQTPAPTTIEVSLTRPSSKMSQNWIQSVAAQLHKCGSFA